MGGAFTCSSIFVQFCVPRYNGNNGHTLTDIWTLLSMISKLSLRTMKT